MKKLTAIVLAAFLFASCKSAGVCGSAKFIGYKDGNNARQVIRNNR